MTQSSNGLTAADGHGLTHHLVWCLKHLLDVKSLRYLSSVTLHDRITKSLLHLHKKKKPPSISAQFQVSTAIALCWRVMELQQHQWLSSTRGHHADAQIFITFMCPMCKQKYTQNRTVAWKREIRVQALGALFILSCKCSFQGSKVMSCCNFNIGFFLCLWLQASLNKLMETLGQSEPYFVKCIRSNAEKVISA